MRAHRRHRVSRAAGQRIEFLDAVLVGHDLDTVRCEYLHRACERRLGQRMSVDADEELIGEFLLVGSRRWPA